MSLINCEVKLVLTWSADYVVIYTDVSDENQVSKIEITETNLYIPVVTLSTQDNTKIITIIKIRFLKE